MSVDVQLCRIIPNERHWLNAAANPHEFFNYGMDERVWRAYQSYVCFYRVSYTLRHRIPVSGVHGQHMDKIAKHQSIAASLASAEYVRTCASHISSTS